MNPKAILLSVVIFSILLACYIFYKVREKEFQYVESCEKVLLITSITYVICCLNERGNLYLCNEKRKFKPGEYIGLQTNLKKLNKYFDRYHVCIYSNFPERDIPLPKRYDIQRNVQTMNVSDYESFSCSKLFFQSALESTLEFGIGASLMARGIRKIWPHLPDFLRVV